MSSSLTAYVIVTYNYSLGEGDRVLNASDVHGVYPSLVLANAAAWNEFAGRVNEAHDFGWPKDHPPAGEAGSGKNEGAVIFEGDEHFAWRVGKAGDHQWMDNFGELVVASEGGWHFVVTDDDGCRSSGLEVVVKKSKVHGFEVSDSLTRSLEQPSNHAADG